MLLSMGAVYKALTEQDRESCLASNFTWLLTEHGTPVILRPFGGYYSVVLRRAIVPCPQGSIHSAMRYKAILLLFVTSAILANAATMTEYFQGTVLSTKQSGSGSPEGFFNVPVGSPMVGSFSFDPSLATVDPSPFLIMAGVTDVEYHVPVTVTMQDPGGTFTGTNLNPLESSVEFVRGDPALGSTDSASVGFQTSAETSGLTLNLPLGAEGDLSLADFPWGVQPTANCFGTPSVDTCSVAGAGTIINEQASSILFSVDAVSLTPLSPAPEPSSILICGLGLIGFVAGLKIRQQRSMVS